MAKYQVGDELTDVNSNVTYEVARITPGWYQLMDISTKNRLALPDFNVEDPKLFLLVGATYTLAKSQYSCPEEEFAVKHGGQLVEVQGNTPWALQGLLCGWVPGLNGTNYLLVEASGHLSRIGDFVKSNGATDTRPVPAGACTMSNPTVMMACLTEVTLVQNSVTISKYSCPEEEFAVKHGGAMVEHLGRQTTLVGWARQSQNDPRLLIERPGNSVSLAWFIQNKQGVDTRTTGVPNPQVIFADLVDVKLVSSAVNLTVTTNPGPSPAMIAQQIKDAMVKAMTGSFARPVVIKNSSQYPHQCPKCGGPAYIGFSSMDCSQGCK